MVNFGCQDSALHQAEARAYRRMPLAEDEGDNIDLANSEPSRSNATVLSNATALYPHTLTSGPESGLCNQLMALVGLCAAHELHPAALYQLRCTTQLYNPAAHELLPAAL